MSTRARIVWFGLAGLLVIAGIACAVFVRDGTGEVLVLALVGSGLIVATSLVFLEVGLSEDRERSRAARTLRPRPPRRRRRPG
jgi:hypothetical protein